MTGMERGRPKGKLSFFAALRITISLDLCSVRLTYHVSLVTRHLSLVTFPTFCFLPNLRPVRYTFLSGWRGAVAAGSALGAAAACAGGNLVVGRAAAIGLGALVACVHVLV